MMLAEKMTEEELKKFPMPWRVVGHRLVAANDETLMCSMDYYPWIGEGVIEMLARLSKGEEKG